jgi:hypothetical protein
MEDGNQDDETNNSLMGKGLERTAPGAKGRAREPP